MADQKSDVIDAVRRDHREVEAMLEAVESSSGDERRRAFEQLGVKLKAHEAAEQKVVHPLTAEEGSADEVDTLLTEESAASSALKKLEGLDVDSAEFERGFARMKADVHRARARRGTRRASAPEAPHAARGARTPWADVRRGRAEGPRAIAVERSRDG